MMNYWLTFQLRPDLSNFSETFQFQKKLSDFGWFFPTSIGSLQLQIFQLKTFQLLVLSNCHFQLHVSPQKGISRVLTDSLGRHNSTPMPWLFPEWRNRLISVSFLGEWWWNYDRTDFLTNQWECNICTSLTFMERP